MGVGSKRCSELTTTQRAAVVVLAGIELVLTVISLADLVRRPPAPVRGGKPLWALAVFVQPVGPVAYLIWGGAPASRSPVLESPLPVAIAGGLDR
jgi:hypothetical protein